MASLKVRRGAYFFILIVVMLPLVVFPVLSCFLHDVYGMPRVENAQIDLAGYELGNRRTISLDGEWEFYARKWIVSDRTARQAPTAMVTVPKTWTAYPELNLPKQGHASYRLVVENCEPGTELVCYLPDIQSRYRIFINGEPVASRGKMICFSEEKGIIVDFSEPNAPGDPTRGIVVSSGVAEIVIEISSQHVGGLYRTPMLSEWSQYHTAYDMRGAMMATFIGIIIISLGCVLLVFSIQVNRRSMLPLIIMDAIVLLRMLAQTPSPLYERLPFPGHSYLVNTVLQTISLFLPVVFLWCAENLVHVQISKRRLLYVALYEILCTPFILFFAYCGRPQLQFLLCLVSYVPFVFVLQPIYRCVCKNVPCSLVVTAIFSCVFSSVVVSAMNFAGFLNVSTSLVPAACFAIAMVLQVWLYLQSNLHVQHDVMEAENLRLRLKQSETNLMLSQIKPHFLYNTLIAIQMLCTTNPDLAAETVMKFSKFLRTNMDFISSTEPIPFERELEHIRNYTDIEQLRFQKRLTVEFDIQTTDFVVPALTIQPLVENAIRHGACKKVSGGTVTVRTSYVQGAYLVEIIDDGEGFCHAPNLADEHTMHGLQNVMFRLEEMMQAKLTIKSVPGLGTNVSVLLPVQTAGLLSRKSAEKSHKTT